PRECCRWRKPAGGRHARRAPWAEAFAESEQSSNLQRRLRAGVIGGKGAMSIAEVVKQDEVPSWSRSADVVVIGQGVAGSCAALEAKRAGADVLVIERASGGGGASALSAGIFYFGGGTDVQRAAGYEDSADNMYDFLMASTGAHDAKLVRRYCDNSAAQFD